MAKAMTDRERAEALFRGDAACASNGCHYCAQRIERTTAANVAKTIIRGCRALLDKEPNP